MYIKKRHKKNLLNISISTLSLLVLTYFVIFAENYETQQRNHWVSALNINIQDNNNNQLIPLSNIIIEGFSDRFTYIVQEWDNLSSIASRFWTTSDNIKNVNELDNDTIQPWQKLTISQEEGIIYEIENEKNLKDFSSDYWLEIDSLMSINYFSDEDTQLSSWMEIFIPISKDKAEEVWLIEDDEEVITPAPSEQETQWQEPTSRDWEVVSSWYHNPQVNNWFYPGHCTWYVADELFEGDRPWWWNARDRYTNASNAGYEVWQSPREWAIVVIRYWAWYWRAYWHVWIVEEIDYWNNQILISDMNYQGRFIVTQRRIPMDDEKITWYIYY